MAEGNVKNKHEVLVLNQVAQIGLKRFPQERYAIVKEGKSPDVILVRMPGFGFLRKPDPHVEEDKGEDVYKGHTNERHIQSSGSLRTRRATSSGTASVGARTGSSSDSRGSMRNLSHRCGHSHRHLPGVEAAAHSWA